MHELSIAMGIVEMVLGEAERHNVHVNAVHLDLGPLSGVVADPLLFSFEIACQGTPLEGSRLEIRDVPIEVYCSTCDAPRRLDSMQSFCCPVCGTPTSHVLHGKEVVITGLEVQDEHPTALAGSSQEHLQAE
jgi:hydrogenase nickel incorporation protein HypA/HybF